MAPISFARGAPSPECVDPDLVADCAPAVLERDATTILSYGVGGGYGPLRELLAERHGVEPGRVFVTTGGLQGFVFFVAAQLQRRPGRVLVEGPTYDRPLKLLGWEGAEVVSLPMDDEGLDLDALEAELDRGGDVSFLYTIPTFQNPSGRTLGAERRRRLAAIVGRARPRRPRGRSVRPGALRGRARRPPCTSWRVGSRVSFTSSFSKTVAPGLRVGYVVVPEELRAAYDDRAVSTYISPPLLPQAIVHEVHASGAFEPNLARIVGLLRARRDAMLEALERELPADVSWNRPEGGYFLWVDFGSRDATDLQRRASDAGPDVRARQRLLPGGCGWCGRGPVRVQLRDARADRRGRRDPARC